MSSTIFTEERSSKLRHLSYMSANYTDKRYVLLNLKHYRVLLSLLKKDLPKFSVVKQNWQSNMT